MTGAELRAIRERYGWTQVQLSRALHYNRFAAWQWEADRLAIPPYAVAWLEALPPLPPKRPWPPATTGGFRWWFAKHDMTCREFAEFCGVATHTVYRWLVGQVPLPLAVRAWLRAGAPPYWLWAPPGSDANCISRPGKNLHTDPQRRPDPVRRIGSHTLRKMRQAAQPRPARRKERIA